MIRLAWLLTALGVLFMFLGLWTSAESVSFKLTMSGFFILGGACILWLIFAPDKPKS
jgi:ABC-type transport system involved in cytochrome c biogenesis permease subunit